MKNKFNIEDFNQLVVEIKDTLETHNINETLHHSIISSVLFNVAVFIDEKTENHLHEFITSYIEEKYDSIIEDSQKFELKLEGELKIKYENGTSSRTTLLTPHLKCIEELIFELEMMTNLRDIPEIDKDIDMEERYESIIRKKRQGIKFIHLNKIEGKSIDFPFNQETCDEFEDSIEGLAKCIMNVFNHKL